MNEMREWVEQYHQCWKSPIEKAFLLALIETAPSVSVSIDMNMGFQVDSRNYTWESYKLIPQVQKFEVWHRDLMFIWSQAPINNYRADFVIGMLAYHVEKLDGEYKEVLCAGLW